MTLLLQSQKRLVGKILIWQENATPFDPCSLWMPKEAEILDVAQDGLAYLVREREGDGCYWVDLHSDEKRLITLLDAKKVIYVWLEQRETFWFLHVIDYRERHCWYRPLHFRFWSAASQQQQQRIAEEEVRRMFPSGSVLIEKETYQEKWRYDQLCVQDAEMLL